VTYCKKVCTIDFSDVYLGIDYGDKGIGVAVSSLGRIATGVKTITRENPSQVRQVLKELKEIINKYKITKVVLGNPINMSGSNSKRSEITLQFKEKFERYFKNKPVILWDERLSTQAVTKTFEGNKLKYDAHVDEMAAVYILQGFLDCEKNKEVIKMNDDKNLNTDEMESDTITLVDEDGEEINLQILSTREDDSGMYALALEAEEDAVLFFKLTPSGDDEVSFEIIEGDDDDYEIAFNLFKEDYEVLGIDVEEVDFE